MNYYVLVRMEDYDYYKMAENNNIYWHDYIKHDIILQLNDTIRVIAAGYEMEKWKVVGEKKFNSVDDAMTDREVYQGWKQNFEKYFEDANGRFLKLEKIDSATGKMFYKDIPNHSILKIQ